MICSALTFATIASPTRELRLLHRWLDSWRGIGDIGIGDIVTGMARQGYDFYTRGMEHGDGRDSHSAIRQQDSHGLSSPMSPTSF